MLSIMSGETEIPDRLTYYFEYDSANKIFAVRFQALTDETFQEFYSIAPRYIEPLEVRAGIADLTQVVSFELSSYAVRKIASLVPLLPDSTPRFVIAPLDHMYGMARMFQLVSDGRREGLAVVRSAVEAYAAIGVKEPRFEKLPKPKINQ
jgi:hypothetical protein